jgi:hypothetical protein
MYKIVYINPIPFLDINIFINSLWIILTYNVDSLYNLFSINLIKNDLFKYT